MSRKKGKLNGSQPLSASSEVTAQCDHDTHIIGTKVNLTDYLRSDMEKYIRKLKIHSIKIDDIIDGFNQLPLVQKLNDMVSKDISLYKTKCRQRCFKCRIYGHIADECEKVCKECGYFHRGKICINNTIEMLQQSLSYSYMKFVKFYDENVKLINNLTENKTKKYVNLEICPCYQDECIQTTSLKKFETLTETKEVMKLSEFVNIQNSLIKKLINYELDNYAAIYKLSKEKIKVVYKKPDPHKGYVLKLRDIKFEPVTRRYLFGSGSLIGANFSYDLDYQPPDYYISPDGQYIKKRIVKEISIPIPNQIITLHNGSHLKYKDPIKLKYGDKMQRFNYVLRIYKKNDKLQQLMDAIDVYNRKLNTLQNQCKDKKKSYAEIGTKLNEAITKYKAKVNELKQKYLEKKKKKIEQQRCITKRITENAKQTTKRLVNKIKERGYKLRDAANNATLQTQLNYLFNLAAKSREYQITLYDIKKCKEGIFFRYDIMNAGIKEYILNLKDVEVTPYHCPINKSPNKKLVEEILQKLIEQVKSKTNKINDGRAGKVIAFKHEQDTEYTRTDSSGQYESNYSEHQ